MGLVGDAAPAQEPSNAAQSAPPTHTSGSNASSVVLAELVHGAAMDSLSGLLQNTDNALQPTDAPPPELATILLIKARVVNAAAQLAQQAAFARRLGSIDGSSLSQQTHRRECFQQAPLKKSILRMQFTNPPSPKHLTNVAV